MENESNVTDYYKKTAMFWSDMITMMSSKPTTLSAVGPLRNLSTNLKKITSELTEANKEIVEFNNFLIEYYKQLGDTWTGAQKEVSSKITKVPQDGVLKLTNEFGLIFLRIILLDCLILKNSQKIITDLFLQNLIF